MNYSTKSLPIASYLYASKEIQFVGANEKEYPKIFFEFRPKNKAEELVAKFYSKEALCSPKELFESHKTLKDMIFDIKRTHDEQSE